MPPWPGTNVIHFFLVYTIRRGREERKRGGEREEKKRVGKRKREGGKEGWPIGHRAALL